ncbi:MAG: hypothetical protein JWO37_552 [Acidimicrobiales bacterium]|nr:hypothetical protein [Acidimicrobiales bacterium]
MVGAGNDKVYIHEFIDIIGQNRAKYMEHMTAGWGETARVERNMLCAGVWGTVGSTGRWPETVNLWELDGWPGLADNFGYEVKHPGMQDPALAAWWAKAAPLRRGGIDRILRPAPYSPTIEGVIEAGLVGAEVYMHEVVRLVPGTVHRYLDLLEQEFLPIAKGVGLQLFGAYRNAMINGSEAIVIWAIDTWDRWGAIEAAYEDDADVARWRRASDEIVVDWERNLMVDSPLNPTRTGRLL